MPFGALLFAGISFLHSLDLIILLLHMMLFLTLISLMYMEQILLYVAAEDEACMAFNREIDAQSLSNESSSVLSPPDALEWNGLEEMPLAGKNISQWMNELDVIAKEVEAELVSRDIGCHLVVVLEAVNLVLFRRRGFKRTRLPIDSKCSYLHSVLSFRYGSGKISHFRP